MKKFALLALVTLVLVPGLAFAQSNAECENGFCSLTNIENLKFAGNAASLPAFLNSLYMICIGLAAVIGVLQIMRAGVTWMTAAGSHEKIGDAKNLIRDSIIGIALVLAPTIVFSIINPEILKLEIGGLEDLAFDSEKVVDSVLWADTESGILESAARCAQQKGVPVPYCSPTGGGDSFPMSSGKTCDGKLYTICTKGDATPVAACEEVKRQIIKPAGSFCDGSKSEKQVPDSCCQGISSGGVCCGSPYSITAPPQPKAGCAVYPDRTDLGWDTVKEMCCDAQDGFGVSCQAQKVSSGGQTTGLMCSCTYTK